MPESAWVRGTHPTGLHGFAEIPRVTLSAALRATLSTQGRTAVDPSPFQGEGPRAFSEGR